MKKDLFLFIERQREKRHLFGFENKLYERQDFSFYCILEDAFDFMPIVLVKSGIKQNHKASSSKLSRFLVVDDIIEVFQDDIKIACSNLFVIIFVD